LFVTVVLDNKEDDREESIPEVGSIISDDGEEE
jgi:hypothetical protein